MKSLSLVISCLLATFTVCFVHHSPASSLRLLSPPSKLFSSPNDEEPLTVQLSIDTHDDEKVTALFAWISLALKGYDAYNNLVLGLAAIYGNLPLDSEPVQLAKKALQSVPAEEERVGTPFSLKERQSASLGAMGAGQWTGQWRTRPHALLDVRDFGSVDDWVQTLPRGCKRTLKRARAAQQNFTVTAHAIGSHQPAPHSTLAHFRCVVQHEVRLLTYKNTYMHEYFDALAEAVSRYVGTTRMTGEIREYRDEETDRIIGFAHEVRKGRTIRGQWFYVNDEAAKRYVWFHSVHSLVERAIAEEGIDVVDLGPSGSDDFSDLKAKYGFVSVEDWPAVADYLGPFWDYEKGEPSKDGLLI